MVAPSLAQVCGADDMRLPEITENVVNTPKLCAREDIVEPAANLLHRHGCCNRIEVTNKEDGLTFFGLLPNQGKQIVRSGWTTPLSPCAKWQRPVVIHEENGLIGLMVLQLHPSTGALAEILPWLLLIVCDYFFALLDHLPCLRSDCDANVLVCMPSPEVLIHACIKEHPVRLNALLEANKVKRHFRSCCLQQFASRPLVSTHFIEQFPPKQIV